MARPRGYGSVTTIVKAEVTPSALAEMVAWPGPTPQTRARPELNPLRGVYSMVAIVESLDVHATCRCNGLPTLSRTS